MPRPRAARSIPKHWSPEQAREFLSLVDGDRTYPLWAFLLGSGLRIGEAVWLRWANVDLDRRIVHVVEFVSTLGHDLFPSAGKNQDAVRSIELDDELVQALRLQRATQAMEALASVAYEANDFVVTKPDDGSYHPQFLSRLIGRYSAELKLPRLTAHGLRHTSATLMLASRVPPKVAAERLGHADPSLTNLYSHVTPTMQRDAADKIGSALFVSTVFQPVIARSDIHADLLTIMEVRGWDRGRSRRRCVCGSSPRASGATLRQAAAGAGVSPSTGHYWLAQSGGTAASCPTAAAAAAVAGGARGDLTRPGRQEDVHNDRRRARSSGLHGLPGRRSLATAAQRLPGGASARRAQADAVLVTAPDQPAP